MTHGFTEKQNTALPASATKNKFLGKPYTMTTPNVSWPDKMHVRYNGSDWATEDGILTNGLRGSRDTWADDSTVVWGSAPGAVNVRVDAESAVGGDYILVHMIADSDGGGPSTPSEAKLEHSDDDSGWTTVTNTTGLTETHITEGPKPYFWEFDSSTAGTHQYWRVTMTVGTASNYLAMTEVEMWS